MEHESDAILVAEVARFDQELARRVQARLRQLRLQSIAAAAHWTPDPPPLTLSQRFRALTRLGRQQ